MRFVRLLLIVVLLSSLCATAGFAQAVNATLVGTITDSSGAVIVKARVTVTGADTGVSRSMETNDSGNYTFPNLAPGTYIVAA